MEPQGATKIVAQWKVGSIPQLLQYDVPKNRTERLFPDIPENMAENQPRLQTALRDAMNCVDREAVRYATNCVRLQGDKGRVDATDGRQILVQSGFEFPFAESVLIPWTNAFACREVTQRESVSIGRTDDWVTINIGPWRFHFRINKDGRYPEFDNFLAKSDEAVANCQISETDADFLLKAIKRLPVDDDLHTPVTVDLNGTMAIRAAAENQPQPTELVLSNSQVTGEPIRINTNRSYLARAVQLGLRRFSIYGPESPVVYHDEARTYAWAVLDKDGAVKDSLRATALQTNDLIAALKRYKKQSKVLQSTLASLRQLQTHEV